MSLALTPAEIAALGKQMQEQEEAELSVHDVVFEAGDPAYITPPYEGDWLIEGLVYTDSFSVLAAASTTGKTCILREVAASAASGTLAFDTPRFSPPRPLRVLVVDADSSIRTMKKSYEALFAARPVKGYITVVHPARELKFDTDEGADWLAVQQQQGRYDLIISESKTKLMATDPDKNHNVSRLVSNFDVARRLHPCAIILSDHFGWEQKRARGASAIKDNADVMWLATKLGIDGDRIRLRVDKDREDLIGYSKTYEFDNLRLKQPKFVRVLDFTLEPEDQSVVEDILAYLMEARAEQCSAGTINGFAGRGAIQEKQYSDRDVRRGFRICVERGWAKKGVGPRNRGLYLLTLQGEAWGKEQGVLP